MALVPDPPAKPKVAEGVRARLARRLPLLSVFLMGVAFSGWLLPDRWPGFIALVVLAVAAVGLVPDREDRAAEAERLVDEARAREAEAVAAEALLNQRLAETASLVWRTAVDAIADPMTVIDAGGRLLHANGALQELFPKAADGVPLSHVVRSPDLLDAVDEVRRGGGRISVAFEDRVPVRRKLIAVVTSLGAEADRSGAAVAIVMRDVSEEERLAQMRADFIANASHELRTPLASLRGFVETLQGPAREDTAARDRFLPIMALQAERMTRLIDDLLSLSRIEMRVHVPPRGEVDLLEVAQFVVQALEPVAAAADVQLQIEGAAQPRMVRGDRDELVQVVQNLVHNAIKYGRAGGHVTVRLGDDATASPRRPRVLLAVEDNGPGIAPEHLPRLTERFYRINALVSREKGGTGLGLAIVKNILNRHRGELRIQSEVGRGSTFMVSLDELAVQHPAPSASFSA